MQGSIRKITKTRLTAVVLLFFIFASYLVFNIFRLSYLNYEYYRDKTYDQITTTSVLKAERGKIYDANMNILADSSTVWRVFISTKDLKTAIQKDKKDYPTIISEGLSSILSIDKNVLYNKITSSKVLDVTLKRDITEKEYKETVKFINDNSLDKVLFTEAESSRHYPEGTLAAHVLGFTGSDNQGLYGLEYYYDDILSGTDGYYVYAKDAGGRALDTEYSDYFPAEDGYSVVTTIDSYIQKELESVIELAKTNHGAQNRVCGIVMDCSTGAILGMATTDPFDPNNPFLLSEAFNEKLENSGYEKESEEYKKLKSSLLQLMWSNKAVSETYEPGSTFKILTVSAALELGAANLNSKFSCKGSTQIGGWTIRCHKAGGHGSGFSLAYGLQMSCNPCMMALASSIGAERFYDYVEKFGYFEKSGIDLPGEAVTIFHNKESIGPTELATASFGQRFKVSIINHLAAISAVANGGKLVTPYIVDKVIDSSGKTISSHKTEVKRQVISAEVANTVSNILIEGVNGDGGAKNAGVCGYDIAAKTGTSQKFDILDENGNSYLRIGSTLAYALDGEKKISMIIVVDEPTSNVKYGSVVAAPYISMLMEKILPYLEYRSSAEPFEYTVENYSGMNINSVKQMLLKEKINYEIVGNGNTVIKQIPSGGEKITTALGKIIIFTEKTDIEKSTVPNLVGMSLADAIKSATESGLNIRLSGMGAVCPTGSDIVTEQSLPPGKIVENGSIIILRAIKKNHSD